MVLLSYLTLCMMAASKRQRGSAWPNLPPDLLGDVLGRLPCLVDRVRLRAVCRPWRSSARLQPPPPMQLPWLAFGDGTLLDVANNTVHRVRLPDGASYCYSAGENMLFLMHGDGGCSLMNAFSGTMTPLPELAALLHRYMVHFHYKIKKVVLSSALDDSSTHHPLIAVMLDDCIRVVVSTCRPAGEVNSCLVMTESDIADIALFQGRIYSLSWHEELFALELNNGRLDKPTPPGVKPDQRSGMVCIEGQRPSLAQQISYRDDGNTEVRRYLVESNGKLLMVKRWVTHISKYSCWYMDGIDKEHMERTWTRRLELFEADLSGGRPRLGWWKRKVDGLGGRALFVCAPCSKSTPAGNGAREDCIYFLHQYAGRKPADPLGDSGVYNMRDKTITPVLPKSAVPAAHLPWDSQRFPAWFFPVED